jgi:hypothetical protein|tara:strand:+ start:88 stop:690 length:603 start_codon:yes stop_codon:yes gene_type:complete
MDVKIKKDGKVKLYKGIKSWSDVTLKKWIELISFHDRCKGEEAEGTIATFFEIPKRVIKELSIKDVSVILESISEMQRKQDTYLKRIIEIDGVKYGFHPDLDQISLGEFADLEQILKVDIYKYLPDIMAILYRPVTAEGENGVYTIEPYDGNISIRSEIMKKMKAEQVQSALVFFWGFVNVLLIPLELFLTEATKEMKMQ